MTPAQPHLAAEEMRQSRMDTLVGYLLLCGVVTSMMLIIIGLIWHYLLTGNFWLGHRLPGVNLFEFVAGEIRIVEHAQLRPRTLVDVGVAILMFTPYLRVLASMIYFMAVLKNWKYSLFTAIVLGVLTFSLFLR